MRRFASIGAVLVAAWLSLASFALAQQQPTEPRILAAGSQAGGWAVVGFSAGSPRPGGTPPPSWRLYHLGSRAPLGSAFNVIGLESRPLALTAIDSALYLVFDPLPSAPAGATRIVRSVTAVSLDAPLPYAYEPQARLAVHASLPGPAEGVLHGFTAGAAGPVALLRPAAGADSAPNAPLPLAARLLELTQDAWRDAPLPGELDPHAVWRLLSVGGDACIVQCSATGEPATLWRPSRSPQDEIVAWRAEPIAVRAPDETLTTSAIGPVSAARTDGGVVSLRLVRESETSPLAQVAGIGADFGLAPGADVINIVWLSDEARPRLHIAVVSTLSGEVLHSGPSTPTLPISRDDIRFLALVLSVIVLTVLVFVLRPEAARRLVVLPEGFALAPPERRLVATLVDVALPLIAVSALTGDGPLFILAAPFRAQSPAEFWPFALTFAAVLAVACVGEWLFGRTPGKALLGVRVVSTSGARLTFWQAFSRNLVKVVCPPLTLLAFFEASRRHPADAIAGAVVVARASGPPSEQG